MKKNLLLALVTLGFGSMAYAQTAAVNSACKNPCDKEILVEEGPLIGVRIYNHPQVAGVIVNEILPNTAAQKNEIAIRDIITNFEGNAITSTQQLINLVAQHKPGDQVSISYKHNGDLITKTITLSALRSHIEIIPGCCDEAIPAVVKQQISFSLYPNPATEKVMLNSTAAVEGDVKISIFNTLGVEVKTIKLKNKGLLNYPLQIASLKEGQYIVKISANNNQYAEKLVVAK